MTNNTNSQLTFAPPIFFLKNHIPPVIDKYYDSALYKKQKVESTNDEMNFQKGDHVFWCGLGDRFFISY